MTDAPTSPIIKTVPNHRGIRPEPETDIRVDPFIVQKRVPVKRLIARMGLAAFDAPAPYTDAGLRPKRVLLPLRQHVGKPAEATVKPGERVRRGDVFLGVGRVKGGTLCTEKLFVERV